MHFSDVVFNVLFYIGIVLDAFLVVLIFLGPYRQYPVLLAYAAVQLLTTGIEAWVFQFHGKKDLYTQVYYVDEVIVSLLLFLTVTVLTYRALEGAPITIPVGKLLGGVALLAILLPFILNPDPKLYFTPRWYRQASQILNFGGALMNLVLWTALLLNRRGDRQLFTVSAGLGVLVTATAISFGVRLLFNESIEKWVYNLMFQLTHVAAFAILCWAFRPAAIRSSSSPQPG